MIILKITFRNRLYKIEVSGGQKKNEQRKLNTIKTKKSGKERNKEKV